MSAATSYRPCATYSNLNSDDENATRGSGSSGTESSIQHKPKAAWVCWCQIDARVDTCHSPMPPQERNGLRLVHQTVVFYSQPQRLPSRLVGTGLSAFGIRMVKADTSLRGRVCFLQCSNGPTNNTMAKMPITAALKRVTSRALPTAPAARARVAPSAIQPRATVTSNTKKHSR